MDILEHMTWAVAYFRSVSLLHRVVLARRPMDGYGQRNHPDINPIPRSWSRCLTNIQDIAPLAAEKGPHWRKNFSLNASDEGCDVLAASCRIMPCNTA